MLEAEGQRWKGSGILEARGSLERSEPLTVSPGGAGPWCSQHWLLHGQWKIPLRSDSKKISVVLCDKFSKRSYKKIVFVQGGSSASPPTGPVLPILASTPTSCLRALVKQIIYTPRAGSVIFIQTVKNSTPVGRGRTTGSDSFPLVSYSDTYQSLRNRSKKLC